MKTLYYLPNSVGLCNAYVDSLETLKCEMNSECVIVTDSLDPEILFLYHEYSNWITAIHVITPSKITVTEDLSQIPIAIHTENSLNDGIINNFHIKTYRYKHFNIDEFTRNINVCTEFVP